ncbi:DUF3800 domain-containing protein [Pectobacterium versatile]|uniref:DUF3800 domain-containing protein n=1 Tax=Pectobacterium versatile TaxID=2488639 RepID=UPI003EBDB39E
MKIIDEIYNTNPRADYLIKGDIKLEFIDSKLNNSIQIADIVAGFLNRFINGLLYKNINIPPIYNEIFSELLTFNRLPFPSPLGINFVLPESVNAKLMSRFEF